MAMEKKHILVHIFKKWVYFSINLNKGNIESVVK